MHSKYWTSKFYFQELYDSIATTTELFSEIILPDYHKGKKYTDIMSHITLLLQDSDYRLIREKIKELNEAKITGREFDELIPKNIRELEDKVSKFKSLANKFKFDTDNWVMAAENFSVDKTGNFSGEQKKWSVNSIIEKGSSKSHFSTMPLVKPSERNEVK